MPSWLRELDDLLRGKRTGKEALAEGVDKLPLKSYLKAAVALGAAYGLCMGLFSLLSRDAPAWGHLFAVTAKVPLLFALTLVVTFPSLYVFSALLGVRLGPADTLRIIVSALTINLAVLASFGPITAFFTLSTTSYYFIKLLNVFFFGLAGLIGLKFLITALERLETSRTPAVSPEKEKPPEPEPSTETPASAAPPPFLPARLRNRTMAQNVFQVWIVLYALVGAQMGWILRPFILDPNLPAVLFRGREHNIFIDVLVSIGKLLGG
ncbi:hypothetical protein HQ560_02335 [bacterium]|nr:hypothetical protein [bacterium]